MPLKFSIRTRHTEIFDISDHECECLLAKISAAIGILDETTARSGRRPLMHQAALKPKFLFLV
jgi:hypothetical protein